MNKIKKIKIISNNKINDKDTGSSEVQIAILSARITELLLHFKQNPKDKHSNKGLVAMVNNRKRHLEYLFKKNPERWSAIIKKLSLKKRK